MGITRLGEAKGLAENNVSPGLAEELLAAKNEIDAKPI